MCRTNAQTQRLARLYEQKFKAPNLHGRIDIGTVPTVNEHLRGIYEEGELEAVATIRKFRIVRTEGKREVTREIEHYNLAAILAVGYRVRSHRGTQFRQWATARLSEFLVKGFIMDDERLKNPPGKGQKDKTAQTSTSA